MCAGQRPLHWPGAELSPTRNVKTSPSKPLSPVDPPFDPPGVENDDAEARAQR